MPRRKALKVVVDIEFHAVTCPGVFLPAKEDIYINIEIFGQLKRTQYHPPVFPFLFHERIRFEKVFSTCTDPIQVAQELCSESVQIELVQLSYPGGELLGTYADNGRDFLFPTPKVSPSYPGVDREVLFQRSASFPGIAPKLEFSSRTTIKEVTSSGRSLGEKKRKARQPTDPAPVLSNGQPVQKETRGPRKSTQSRATNGRGSPDKKQKSKATSTAESRRGRPHRRSKSASRGTTMWGYEQPTIASRARSPSPYTRRRMAELAIKDPFESATKTKPFKTEVNNRPEFVVRKVPKDALSLDRTPPPPRSPSCERRSPRRSVTPTRRSYTSPRQTMSPRNAYNIALSNSSDDAESFSSGFSSDESRDFVIDPYLASYRTGQSPRSANARPRFFRARQIDAYSDYLAVRSRRSFPEGRRDVFIPIGARAGSDLGRHSTPIPSPRSTGTSPRFSPRTNAPLKSCLASHSAPASSRYYSKYSQGAAAARIDSGLKRIKKDIDKLALQRCEYRPCVRKKRPVVRFEDTDTSELHTSMRCGRRTPTGSRLSSARSAPSTSPRVRDPSFSMHDLDLEPTSSFGRRRTAPNSILARTPLEDRLKAQPSPYEKIRDRVRALLSSPRATQIADDAAREAEVRYRQRLSRSPSPRSPRYY